MSNVAIQETLKQEVAPTSTKRGKKKSVSQNETQEGDKNMTPSTENTTQKMKVQRTVFDLAKFDNVMLVKEIDEPKKPETPSEALAMLNNDTNALLDIIHKGLKEAARDAAYEDISGFKVYDDETDEAGEEYTGTFADKDKGKLIGAAILSLAKMQGYDKNKTREEKRALKEKAAEFLRSNPAMLASIQK